MRKLIEEIGDAYFSWGRDVGGWGDSPLPPSNCRRTRWSRLEMDKRWKKALDGWKAPPGFAFIADAEGDTIAMVPKELAPHFVKLLNTATDTHLPGEPTND